MATLYFGQILHRPPDMALFRRQAQECGYDEEACLDAIRKVPIIPRERVQPIMDFFSQLTQMLAHSGLERMRKCEAEKKLAILNRELAQRVEARTRELATRNRQLAADIALRQKTERDLREVDIIGRVGTVGKYLSVTQVTGNPLIWMDWSIDDEYVQSPF